MESRLSRKAFIKSLIVHKQTKEFSSCLRKKADRELCIEGFFELLSPIPDDKYMSDLFELIVKKSGLTSSELSTILTHQLSTKILAKNFDLCQKILHLPFQSLKIPLSTYETIQLIHTCSNTEQLIECLSILIEKNLPYDSEYLSWILVILFEYYLIGDEIIIEYILSKQKNMNLLFICYGNNNVTPLMLFLRLYSNKKCQLLIDHYLSTINDQSILLQCDKWNRSYLMHLLCGKCQHDINENSIEINEINEELMNKCPHSSAILSMFSMLYNLKNNFDTPVKTILTSNYCLSLQMILLNYLYVNNSSFQFDFHEFFRYFPGKSILIYANYIKRLVRNINLDSTLSHLLNHQRLYNDHNEYKIEFLLRQGARIHDMSTVEPMITYLLRSGRSLVPFILLDYSLYTNISYELWRSSTHDQSRLNLYICRIIQCGYPSEFREKFDEFKSSLPQQTRILVEKFIDLKNPSSLSKLCLQKLRSSLKNLGDDTIDTFKDYLSNRLRQSIVHYEYEECRTYFRTVMFST